MVETGGPSDSVTVIHEAKRLMAEGKPGEAYDLLVPLEAEMAGNVDYDYLLAVSALDSGNPARASLVFERILAVYPNFAGARLDMARAYYDLGNYDQAKTEFDAVLKLDPPALAKSVAKRYLAAIEETAKAERTTVSGYVEATLGYDDNVNNSTAERQVYVPAFAVDLTLSPTNVKSSDTYSTLTGGLSVTRPFESDRSAYLMLDGKVRRNFEENDFDTDNFSVRLGMNLGPEKKRLRVGVKGERAWLDNVEYRNTVGLNTEWRHWVNRHNQLIFFGQYNQIRYPDLKVNDVDQLLGGISWLHGLTSPHKAIAYVSAYAGNEEEKEARADGGQILGGLRLGGQVTLRESLAAFASVGGQYGDYDETNAAFLEVREDLQFDARVGLSWQPKENWTLRPQIAYIENDSNIAIYEYERTVWSLTLRRTFQ